MKSITLFWPGLTKKTSPPASKESLIRRAAFDLTDLPPSLAQIDAFLADDSQDVYEKVSMNSFLQVSAHKPEAPIR